MGEKGEAATERETGEHTGQTGGAGGGQGEATLNQVHSCTPGPATAKGGVTSLGHQEPDRSDLSASSCLSGPQVLQLKMGTGGLD